MSNHQAFFLFSHQRNDLILHRILHQEDRFTFTKYIRSVLGTKMLVSFVKKTHIIMIMFLKVICSLTDHRIFFVQFPTLNYLIRQSPIDVMVLNPTYLSYSLFAEFLFMIPLLFDC